jgi:pilus assembly protein CpaF
MRPVLVRVTAADGTARLVSLGRLERPAWIGRDAACDVVLAAAQVSRRHVSLRRAGRQVEITDHSANGTLVDARLLKQGSRRVGSGTCRLELGPFTLELDVPRATAALDAAAATALREPRVEPALRRRIHQQLLDHLDLPRLERAALEDTAMRQRVLDALRRIIAGLGAELPRSVDAERLTLELTDEALGLGPLEALLADPEVTEIMVVEPETIYAERRGRIELTQARFTDDDAVRAVIERIVTPLGRRIDESTPLVDARLKDGSRVNAVIPPLAIKGACITIRKFTRTPLDVAELIRLGSLDQRMARFLTRAVAVRKNIVISGGTGSGKTTLLNVLSSAVPSHERIVTIEDAAELRLGQPHVVALEARPHNLEGKGQYTIRDLVKNALRMRPDRIVVGECRGSEAIDMLQAMNTGHEGSMTTTHANSPREAVQRIETLCLMAGIDLPVRAVRAQIASSVHLIVQQSRLSDGSRRVTSIAEVLGVDPDGDLTLRDLFSFVRLGTGPEGKVLGEFRASGYLPSFIDQLIAHGVAPDGDFV